MCAIDDAEYWKVSRTEMRTARKLWSCEECGRRIVPGERYQFLTGCLDSHWSVHRTCLHCTAAGEWLNEVCGGYPISMLREELIEHWNEGFRSIAYGRLVVAQKLRWHDGRDPVPDSAAVAELAKQMMRAQVAA